MGCSGSGPEAIYLTGPEGPQGLPGLAGTDGLDAQSRAVRASAEVDAATLQIACHVQGGAGTVWEFGSGIKLADGGFLTAAHVFSKLGDADVGCFIQSGSSNFGVCVPSMPTAGDPVRLEVNWTTDGAAIEGMSPIYNWLPELGDVVVAAGYPAVGDVESHEVQHTAGLVSATNVDATLHAMGIMNWDGAFTADAAIWHGNSGSPAFNAAGGLIGIVVGSYNGYADNTGPDLAVVAPLTFSMEPITIN